MKFWLGVLALLAACAALAALIFTAPTSTAAPLQHTYTGQGQISLGTKGQRWCLGIAGTAPKKGRPVVYAVRCNSAGVWQTVWHVRITGDAPDYIGEIQPVNDLLLCLEENPGNSTASLIPCNQAVPLSIQDTAKAANLLNENWVIRQRGYYLSVTNPVSDEKIMRWIDKNPGYTQVFRFGFQLNE